MARTLLALLWAWATLGFLCARSEAVGFEVVSPRTRVKPLARMQSAAAYCGALDIFVVMGGFYNAKRMSYLSGDFWVYSFSDASWHNLGARYARRTFSPVKQFGASLTHIESVTSHCQFLVHSGKYADFLLAKRVWKVVFGGYPSGRRPVCGGRNRAESAEVCPGVYAAGSVL